MDTAPAARPLLLVVDDELPVLRVVERLAAKAGFDVVSCASGSEAMRALMRKPADLAMVDLRMPDVNGLELLRQIRDGRPKLRSDPDDGLRRRRQRRRSDQARRARVSHQAI